MIVGSSNITREIICSLLFLSIFNIHFLGDVPDPIVKTGT